MKHTNLKFLSAALIVLGGAVVILFAQTRPDLPPLLPHAHKIVAVPGAHPDYWWVSAREVMFARDDNALVCCNVDTGVQTPASELSRLYQNSGGKPESIRVSPTGDWVLWTGRDNAIHLADLDGKQHVTIPQAGPTLNIWKSDGRGWFTLDTGSNTVDSLDERSLDAPQKIVRTMPIAFPFPNDAGQVNLRRITASTQSQLLIPVWAGKAGRLGEAKIMAAGLGASARLVRPLTFQPPYPNAGGDLAFLPAAHKMAWRLDILLPRPHLMQDLGVTGSPQQSVGLWVTDQATRQTTALGYVDVAHGERTSSLSNVQFAPDGKRLSFLYRNALWTVPLE